MSTTLCQACFPGWDTTEILTVPPIHPCQRCGTMGERNVYRDGDVARTLQPHQQRVVAEKAELDDRLAKLSAFLPSPTFAQLDAEEQTRLRHQHDLMGQLSAVLGERIEAFGAYK